MGMPRRLVLVLCTGLFLSSAGAVLVNGSKGAQDAPVLVANPVEPSTTTTLPPTTLPPVTVPPAPEPAPAPAVQPGPAAPPKDPYVVEPLVQIGTIEIPRIALVHPIFNGISLRTIDHGPSHWPGTALPGQVGNAVFAGHRVTHTHPFRNIDQLSVNDEVIFTVNNVRSVYLVTGSEIVTPKALQIINQTATPTATLFGCHPPGSAKFRYVVHLALQS